MKKAPLHQMDYPDFGPESMNGRLAIRFAKLSILKHIEQNYGESHMDIAYDLVDTLKVPSQYGRDEIPIYDWGHPLVIITGNIYRFLLEAKAPYVMTDFYRINSQEVIYALRHVLSTHEEVMALKRARAVNAIIQQDMLMHREYLDKFGTTHPFRPSQQRSECFCVGRDNGSVYRIYD